MTVHTGGPWTYFVGNANGRGLIRIEQDGTGVHVASMQRGAISQANARLIAAAPDLLFALQTVMGTCEHGQKEDWVERCAIGRAAISKATSPT